MASYNYDESGVMALYFILTFLVMILIPFTYSTLSSSPAPKKRANSAACDCGPCTEQRKKNAAREKGVWWKPKVTLTVAFVIGGWVAVGLLSWKILNTKLDTKIYNPFEILGISSGTSEKDIKSHFKKLSKKFHPDKVKLAVNQTMEEVSAHFVDLTKAYKALTDETIRKNLEEYGHPDGRQEIAMGIALPAWIVEAQNNIWVLAAYGVVFGGALPALVYNWWFGSRQRTKDGVLNDTARAFFLGMTETTEATDVARALGQANEWLRVDKKAKAAATATELAALETTVKEKVSEESWAEVRRSIKKGEDGRLRALVLLYAHLLRLHVESPSLQSLQAKVLLHTPSLLNAYLNISATRGWLAPITSAIRLQACLAQAVAPDTGDAPARLAQLPGLDADALATLPRADIVDVAAALAERKDARSEDVRKAADRWGRVELVDASFRVIGERIVTPSALIHLVVKLRIAPPAAGHANGAAKTEEPAELPFTKVDEAFLNDPKDAEELPEDSTSLGVAHAPRWPSDRKPSWWIVLADMRSNRAVIPPMRITDVPFSDPTRARNYRTYKMKFNGPQGAGVFPWRVLVLSDTFIGEDASRSLTLKVEEMSALGADAAGADDEISDPEEDSLAGQMAAMRGGPVKTRRAVDSDDDESSTDDDEKDKGSSSDSDSD